MAATGNGRRRSRIDPLQYRRGQEEAVRIDQARIDHWVAQGAQMSPRVKSIIKNA